jgi:ABC-2 type transport system permease protein
MSTLTVAKKDFKSARRSRMLWGGAISLGLIAALLAYVSGGSSRPPTESVQSVFNVLTLVLAVLLPIIALVASYLAIAGERESGGIKFLLSLPNTRREVFVGKLLSRAGIVAGGVAFLYVAAVSVALGRHGAFPAMTIFGTFLLTVLYGSTFVSVAVSMSAAAASRSRAIAGALTAYFVLVILYVFPVIRISRMVEWVHTTLLGSDPNPDLYNAVRHTSPYLAYQKATNFVLPAEMVSRPFRDSIRNTAPASGPGPSRGLSDAVLADPDLPLYLTDEFSLVVLAFWALVPLALGYAVFKRADLE